MPFTITYTPATDTASAFNTIIGTDAAERVPGTEINDVMLGGAGDDYLNGADGTDAVDGGAGADILTGGRGSDVFFFHAASEANLDLIADFRPEDFDVISFSLFDTNSSIAGDQNFNWIGTAPFTAESQLRYVQLSGQTFIQGNTTGDLLPEFTIVVSGLVDFVPSNFFL